MSREANRSNVDRLVRNLVKRVTQRDKNGGARNQAAGHSEGTQRTRDMAEGDRFPFGPIIGLVSLALLWVIFSRFVVPAVIESAYRGESLPFLNDIFSGRTVHPVGHYLAIWERTSWRILGMPVVVGLIFLPLVASRPAVQSYLETRYGNELALKPLPTNTILALFGFAVVFYLYFLHPVGYIYFISEDYFAEYASFGSWAMASCFSAWMLLNEPDSRKPGLVLVTLGTFFVAMEEISWGQRILGLPSPKLFAAYNSQGEMNVHNLLTFSKNKTAAIAIFLWGIFLPLLTTKWGQLRRWCSKLGIPIVPIHLWPFILLAIFFLTYDGVAKGAEAAELFLGIGIAALTLDLVLTTRRGNQARGAASTAATAGMIVTLGILTVFLVHFYGNPGSVRHISNAFAANYLPSAGMHRQAEILFEYMNQHPHLLQPQTHLHQGALLIHMGQHTKAKEILQIALAEQKRLEQQTPEDPVPSRNKGHVLRLLGREQEAEGAFLEAIQKDRARLERSKDAGTEAMVRWSLAITFVALGDYEAASQQLSRARAIASPRIRSQKDRWMRMVLSEEDLGRLSSFPN